MDFMNPCFYNNNFSFEPAKIVYIFIYTKPSKIRGTSAELVGRSIACKKRIKRNGTLKSMS